jgi:hypothetical protein
LACVERSRELRGAAQSAAESFAIDKAGACGDSVAAEVEAAEGDEVGPGIGGLDTSRGELGEADGFWGAGLPKGEAIAAV